MTAADLPKSDSVVTRVIMVQFRPEATADERAEFRSLLEGLAAQAAGLVRMTCGEHLEVAADEVLSTNAPDAVFGNFMSVWEFRGEQALNDFLLQPAHRAMAATKFRKVVQRRYVANIG